MLLFGALLIVFFTAGGPHRLKGGKFRQRLIELEARALVDHITWRAVQICALILALAILYRLVLSRFIAKRSP